MRLDFLIEERSTEVALANLVRKILPDTECLVYFHPFHGKPDLLKKLPERLRAYKNWIADDQVIIVMLDRDSDDCRELKTRMEKIAVEAGLKTRSSSPDQFQLINRIVVEELEAWFFGDMKAINKAYPSVPANLDKKARFRDPDAIRGGTSEQLEKLLKGTREHRNWLKKSLAACEISKHMDPDRNRSKSFQVFRDALRSIPQREPGA